MANQKKVKVTLVKSVIGAIPKHRATIKGLGLGKMNSVSILEDTAAVRGMITSVIHLLNVEELA